MIDIETLNGDFLSLGQIIADILNPLIGNLRNMQQAILAGQNCDERTEINDASDLTGVYRANLSLGCNGHDHFNRRITRRLILTKDLHSAIVIDINRST